MPVVEGTSVSGCQGPEGSQVSPDVGSLTLLPQATPTARKRVFPTTRESLVKLKHQLKCESEKFAEAMHIMKSQKEEITALKSENEKLFSMLFKLAKEKKDLEKKLHHTSQYDLPYIHLFCENDEIQVPKELLNDEPHKLISLDDNQMEIKTTIWKNEREDCEKSVLQEKNILDFLKNISPDHDSKGLRNKCVSLIKEDLCVQNFIEAYILALYFRENELLSIVTDFFIKNVKEIIDTDIWLKFLTEYGKQCNELMIKFMKSKNSNEEL